MTDVTELPTDLSLPVINVNQITTPAERALADANSIVIEDGQMAQVANDELRNIKKRAADLDDERKSITKGLDEAKRKIMDKYAVPLDILARAEGILKAKLLDWTKRENKRIAEEQAKIQEAQRKEAERLAAQAQKAEASGKVERAAVLAEAAIAVAAAAPVISAPTKLEGSSIRKVYRARVVDKGRAIKALMSNPMFSTVVIIDESGLNKLASQFKESFSIDGCELKIEEVMSSRK